MRIAIVQATSEEECDSGHRAHAMKRVLEAESHEVDLIRLEPGLCERLARRRRSPFSRLKRRLLRRPSLQHLWDLTADAVLPRLRRGGYSCVIARGQRFAGALLRLNVPRIVDLEGIEFLTELNSWDADRRDVDETYRRERALVECADAVLGRHGEQGSLLAECFGERARARLVVVPSGCDGVRPERDAPAIPRILFVGSLTYRNDPYLLALLAGSSPVPVHCYGPRDRVAPGFLPHPLDHRGDEDGCDPAGYSLGLVTAARDRVREREPSGRFAFYLACGLPVLFPRWMRAGHHLPDCALPYDESDFPDVVRAALRPERLAALRTAARNAAARMLWPDTLAPLAQIVRNASHRSAPSGSAPAD